MAVAEHGESIIRFNKEVRGVSAKGCQFVRGRYALPIQAAMNLLKAPRERRASGKLKGWGTLVELCTSKDSNLGNTAKEFKGVKVIRVTKDEDFLNDDYFRKLHQYLADHPGVSIRTCLASVHTMVAVANGGSSSWWTAICEEAEGRPCRQPTHG